MCCEGFTSPLCDVKIGVPQGSVLGPMLFLIYINDLANCLNFDTTLYADDCVLTISHKNTLTISFKINLKALCIFVGYCQLVSSYSKDVLFLLCQVTSKAMPNSKTKSNATEIQTLTTKVAEILQSYLESIYERACKEYQIKYTDEITALKAEIAALSRSQDFISKQYDEIIKLNSKKMEAFDELKQKA